MLTVDPPTFQQAALTWIAVLTVVVGAVLTAVMNLWPRVAQLMEMVKSHQEAIVVNNEAVRAVNPDAPSVQPVDTAAVEVKK